jgi:hypothetical protein
VATPPPTPRTKTSKAVRAPDKAELDGSLRGWLRRYGYNDIADLVAEIIAEWQADGRATRRNWWDILSGDKDGKSREVAGRTFPVLASAQRRQGKAVTKNAIQRSRNEPLPPVPDRTRWG